MEAFVRAPLPAFQRSNRSLCQRTPKRQQSRTVTVSRSLDSYREGNRFAERDAPRNPSFSERPFPLVKHKMSLLKALMKLNVASSETCELLIRSGRVRVNGNTIREHKTRIDIFQDLLWISGTDYGTVHDGEPVQFSDSELEPRTQKDFRSSIPEGGLNRKFTRRIDGGFYSRRRYLGGK
ncbi:RNA-binding S4 [Gracilaria domingensis]|nr:RNA-binding S4 [Gracilaria domingensis]